MPIATSNGRLKPIGEFPSLSSELGDDQKRDKTKNLLGKL